VRGSAEGGSPSPRVLQRPAQAEARRSVANYTLGLGLTYLEERPPLQEAKSLILKAISIYGQSNIPPDSGLHL